MILIFSIYNDYTTTCVCQWLKHHKQPFIRINGNKESTCFISADTEKDEIIFMHEGKPVNLAKVTAIWYRKSGLSGLNFRANYFVEDGDFFFENNKSILARTVKEEVSTLSNYLHWYFEQVPHLGKRSNATLNKSIVLAQARRLGLNVPESYILTEKKDLIRLLEEKGELITKALKDGIYQFNPHHAYYSYTERVTLSNIEAYPAVFAPTLFQPLVKKKFELRIFILGNQFYAMAIFSQDGEKTKVDSRRGDADTAVRRIPFQLPETVRLKLKKLMDELDLNTGSADIIVDEHDNYIFLEVNPVGQFSMVSDPCNYHLEQKVANYLWTTTNTQ